MRRRLFRRSLLVLLPALVLAACSGDSPVTPSSAQSIVLRGSVLGAGSASAAAAASGASAAVDPITVTVLENPAIVATVGADGSFTLRGLPPGSFTLVFTQGATNLGTLSFDGVLPNQEITITIDVSTGTVVLVEERRTGIGHGDLEIEGLVESVLVLNSAGESRFLIDGYTVVARPGETTIREGNQARSVEDVTVGRRVHVKGVWLDPEPGVQPFLAHEIKLQGDEDGDDDDTTSSCMISGGKVGSRIELEGNVLSGNATSFELRVNGNRARFPVDVDAGGATFQCHPAGGPNAPTSEQCKAKVVSGTKVHVSGTLQSCTASDANVQASKVIVQK
jgi:hypothetical protein